MNKYSDVKGYKKIGKILNTHQLDELQQKYDPFYEKHIESVPFYYNTELSGTVIKGISGSLGESNKITTYKHLLRVKDSISRGYKYLYYFNKEDEGTIMIYCSNILIPTLQLISINDIPKLMNKFKSIKYKEPIVKKLKSNKLIDIIKIKKIIPLIVKEVYDEEVQLEDGDLGDSAADELDGIVRYSKFKLTESEQDYLLGQMGDDKINDKFDAFQVLIKEIVKFYKKKKRKDLLGYGYGGNDE